MRLFSHILTAVSDIAVLRSMGRPFVTNVDFRLTCLLHVLPNSSIAANYRSRLWPLTGILPVCGFHDDAPLLSSMSLRVETASVFFPTTLSPREQRELINGHSFTPVLYLNKFSCLHSFVSESPLKYFLSPTL